MVLEGDGGEEGLQAVPVFDIPKLQTLVVFEEGSDSTMGWGFLVVILELSS